MNRMGRAICILSILFIMSIIIPTYPLHFISSLIYFPEGTGEITHPAPLFHHESVEGRRRGCLLHRESGYIIWPPAPLPNHNAEDWRAGIGSILVSIQPAAGVYYIL